VSELSKSVNRSKLQSINARKVIFYEFFDEKMPFLQNKIPITLSVTLSVMRPFFCREKFDKIRWGKKESVVLLEILRGPSLKI
jgi:hypothetical protein